VRLLWPFFRYSAWRDAWVLRIIGERFGPVVRPSPGPGPALRADVARPHVEHRPGWPASLRAPAALLAAAGIAVAAVLGFVLARSALGGSSPPTLSRPVSNSVLEASLPAGWPPQATQAAAGLGLTDALGAASGGRSIVVGRATTTDPSLLPASILASMRRAPAAQLVTLAGATFDRYSDLTLRAGSGSQWVYAVPTGSGTVLAVCRAPGQDAGFASICQRVVQSIRLRSGPLSPGLVPAYGSTLTAAIGRLNAARSAWGSQLSTARTALLQASAANQLAAADTQAAATLTGAVAGPAQNANAAVVAALSAGANAYSALARAAAHRRVRVYRLSAAAVAQANDALASALTGLGAYGYRIT
jgi:hypothetical protein